MSCWGYPVVGVCFNHFHLPGASCVFVFFCAETGDKQKATFWNVHYLQKHLPHPHALPFTQRPCRGVLGVLLVLPPAVQEQWGLQQWHHHWRGWVPCGLETPPFPFHPVTWQVPLIAITILGLVYLLQTNNNTGPSPSLMPPCIVVFAVIKMW